MKGEVKLISWHEKQPILSVDCHSTSRRIATGGADNQVRIWQFHLARQSTQPPVQSQEKSSGDTVTLDDGDDEDVVAKKASVKVAAADTGVGEEIMTVEYLSTLSRHTLAVNVVRFSPNGDYLASAGDDGAVIVWKLSSREHRVVSFGDDDEVKEVWVTTLILRDKSDDIYDLAWTADSLQLAVGSIDNAIRVWDVQKGTCIKKVSDHTHYVQGVAWDPLGKFLVSQSSDRTCRVYQRNSKSAIAPYGKIDRHSVALPHKEAKQKDNKDPDTMTDLGDKENTALSTPLLQLTSFRLFADESLPTFFRRLAFSPDGSLLVAPAGVFPRPGSHQPGADNQEANTVYLFGRRNLLEPVAHLPGHAKAAVVVRFCPLFFELRSLSDKQTPSLIDLPYRMVFAVATLDSVVFYDTQQRDPIALISKFHYSALTDLSWSSDGHTVFVSSRDGFCSVVRFSESELGTVVSPPAKILEQQQQQQQAILTATATALQSPIKAPQAPQEQEHTGPQELSSSRAAPDSTDTTPATSLAESVSLDAHDGCTPTTSIVGTSTSTSPLKRSGDPDTHTSASSEPKKRRITPQLISGGAN